MFKLSMCPHLVFGSHGWFAIHHWGIWEGNMASATKAGFGDTHLSFNSSSTSSLQGTLGKMLSKAGSGPSSSVKEDDARYMEDGRR